MDDVLVSLLPPGEITSRDRGVRYRLLYADVGYNDGHGACAIEVGIQTGGFGPCPAFSSAGSTCTATHTDGGTPTLLQSYEHPDHRDNTREWLA